MDVFLDTLVEQVIDELFSNINDEDAYMSKDSVFTKLLYYILILLAFNDLVNFKKIQIL